MTNTPTIHNCFKLNGVNYNANQLQHVAYSFIKEGEAFEKNIGDFLLQWLDNKPYVTVNTSGSTGQAKPIQLLKSTMVNSALATGTYFNLSTNTKALHCLPSYYIAGKMMLVRAMVLGWNLHCIAPSATPILPSNQIFDFAAMVPLQLSNCLQNHFPIKHLILGGTAVSEALKQRLLQCNTNFYETYGMTETATHIAIKPLASKAQKARPYFMALPGITFTTDARGCLIIQAPKLLVQPIQTNDLVDIKNTTSFTWLGRFDNVINTGGIKIFPEQVEQKLHPYIAQRFFISSISDSTFGETVILIIENYTEDIKKLKTDIQALKAISKYELPKAIYTIRNFSETKTGKIQRRRTLNQLKLHS